MCLRMAIMYEGGLRWNDLQQIFMGNIIITQTFLRLFIQSAKTDAYRVGQWVTIAVSEESCSAWKLLMVCLSNLAKIWHQANEKSQKRMLGTLGQGTPSNIPLMDIPLVFEINASTSLPQFDKSVSYRDFLKKLKIWSTTIGMNPQDIGTHSLRRGMSSDMVLQGIPDRLRREHGRWKSEKVADGYIDESINIQLLLQTKQKVKK